MAPKDGKSYIVISVNDQFYVLYEFWRHYFSKVGSRLRLKY